MNKKFRNSLFGFNKEDVMKYIYESKEAESKLKQNIKEVESLNLELSDKCSVLEEKISEISAQLDEFKKREDEITRLGQSIGRLYLVAQANAGTILNAAQENARLSKIAVEKNMSVVDDTETELSEISRLLDEKTKSYLDEVAQLKSIIAQTKSRIEDNDSTIDEVACDSENVLKGVTE